MEGPFTRMVDMNCQYPPPMQSLVVALPSFSWPSFCAPRNARTTTPANDPWPRPGGAFCMTDCGSRDAIPGGCRAAPCPLEASSTKKPGVHAELRALLSVGCRDYLSAADVSSAAGSAAAFFLDLGGSPFSEMMSLVNEAMRCTSFMCRHLVGQDSTQTPQ